jgi:hypothetical protein
LKGFLRHFMSLDLSTYDSVPKLCVGVHRG